MKRSLLIQVLLIFTIVIFSCDNSTETEAEIADPQLLFFYAFYSNSYWDDISGEIVDKKNTTGGGVLFADPIPNFEYFNMSTDSFSSEDYFRYLPGYIIFGDLTLGAKTMITSNLDPLVVEVKTSIGAVSGSVNIPDSIESIKLSVNDTLALGEPLTITWTAGEADFYTVNCYYYWIDDNGNTQSVDLSEFVSGNSITYPGSEFVHNGEIDFIYIYPSNGPLPKEGSTGNMTGSGKGFLYYNRSGIGHQGESIIVGSGNNNLPKKVIRVITEEELLEKNKEMLERRIRETR